MAQFNESVAATDKAFEFAVNGSQKLAINGSGAILDSNGLNRQIHQTSAKTIVDGAATALFSVPVAQGSYVGGVFDFQVYASDGTDFQVISGSGSYSVVNKAGTLTSTITQAAAVEAKAVSAGTSTLTLAWTIAEDSADVATIKLQPTGSLTETAYTVLMNIRPLKGTVTLA